MRPLVDRRRLSLDLMGIIVPILAMETDTLVKEIEDFAKTSGVAPATVTSRAVGNSRLYSRMKSGGSCTLRVADRIRQYMNHVAPPEHTPTEGAK